MHRLTRIAAAALLLATASLRADITLPAPVPPQADAQSARVWRGGEVTIELRVHYGGSGALRFMIVRPPEHGRLSGLRGLGDNRASILYTHDGSPAATADGFAYVVQAGGRTSSPAEVRIAVEDAPARLEVPGKRVRGNRGRGQRDAPLADHERGRGSARGKFDRFQSLADRAGGLSGCGGGDGNGHPGVSA